MKITFIYPDIQPQFRFWKGYYYSGIGSLSSFLKLHGHKTSLIHITKLMDKETFIKHIFQESPDLIGFSSTQHVFPIVKKLARWIKEEKIQLPVICGGIYPTLNPNETINTEGIDMICRGEGEEPLCELCTNIEKGRNIKKVSNIWYKYHKTIYKNPLKQPCHDLSNLPFPDRTIFKYRNLFNENQGYATVMVSRGCPYQCSYCCNQALRNIYDQKVKYTRFRSIDSAISEIKKILRDFPFIQAIHFDDDILFLNESWGNAFFSRYKDEVGVPFRCNARPNLLNKKRIELMSEAGCIEVAIGLESGNDHIRNKILKRNLSRDQIKNASHLCKNSKIHIKSFNMVGIPYEDTRAVLETIKLNAEIGVEEIQTTIFQPYKGTSLFDLCLEKGLLTNEELSFDFFSPAPLLLNSITPEQILMFRDYFKVFVGIYKILYALPRSISGFLIKSSDKMLSSKYISKFLNKIYIPMNYLYRLIQ